MRALLGEHLALVEIIYHLYLIQPTAKTSI